MAVFVLLTFWCLFPAVAKADGISQARAEITAGYARQDAAIGKKDIDAVLAWYTPQFEEVHHETGAAGTVVTYNQLRPDLKQIFGPAKSIGRTTKVTAFLLREQSATVSIRQTLTAIIIQQATGQERQMVVDGTADDTWIKSPAGWRLNRSDTRTGQVTVTFNDITFEPVGMPKQLGGEPALVPDGGPEYTITDLGPGYAMGNNNHGDIVGAISVNGSQIVNDRASH